MAEADCSPYGAKRDDRALVVSGLKRTVSTASRNALYAAAGRLAFGVVTGLLKSGLRTGVHKVFLREVLSADPLKWAFLSAGLSCFRLLKHIASKLCSHLSIPEKFSYVVAGFISGLPVMVMERGTRVELCLHVLVRALQVVGTSCVLPLFPKVFRDFEHYDIVVMCLSASQILYGFVFAPYTMPPSYLSFLSKTSMLDERVVRSYAGLTRHQISPELVELCVERGRRLPHDPSEHLSVCCSYAHEGLTCNQFCFMLFCKNMVQVGLPLYLPLKVATIVVQYKKLIRKPLQSLCRAARSVFFSTLFLALYSVCSTRYACLAAQRNIRGGLLFAIASSLAGISTLIEPKGRRADLAFYCLIYAIRSFVLTQCQFGRLPYPRQSSIFMLYLFSVVLLISQYDYDPDKLDHRSRYVISRIAGGEILTPTEQYE
ncbi:hypothetical protein DPX39_100146300 [Trypanosoma brucei equiperdum]|uniref:Transmembrane protein 135 N-terminal domain-containing protein n=1 Tax=Trypanosoma brucei equiperdum TaxID=630700 RepID=A0A3L6KXT9_9TRYP|nr:hypothetical protein DPX39_100146300 [Trypanosoma brucei equiperdum]